MTDHHFIGATVVRKTATAALVAIAAALLVLVIGAAYELGFNDGKQSVACPEVTP